MAAELLSFFRPAKSISGDWSTQEIAEFYRVEAALVQAGASVCVDRGVSDEGDPWFVFCRSSDGEVIVHFARMAGKYLIVAESVGLPLFGSDFRRLLADFVELNPSLIPLQSKRGSKLMLHPASLLAAVVATALYHMSGTEAVASAIDSSAIHGSQSKSYHVDSSGILGDGNHDPDGQWSARQVAAVMAAMVALASLEFSPPTKVMIVDIASAILDFTNDHLISPHQEVAQELLGINEHSLIGNQIDTHGIHTWLDSLYDYAAGHALLQQFGANANDNALPKWAVLMTEAVPQQLIVTHWWESLSPDADSAPKYFAWTDSAAGISGGGVYGVASAAATSVAPLVALQLQSQPTSPSAGSSSPDQPATQVFQAASLVNSALSAADHVIPQYSISGNVSLQVAITVGAVDVFGPVLPSIVQAVVQHDPIMPDARTSPFQSQALTSASTPQPQPAAILPVSETAYQAFNAAASAILSEFVTENKNNIDEVVSTNHVLLFDTNPTDLHSPDYAAKTWAMTDGSTITIIGLLPHNLTVQA